MNVDATVHGNVHPKHLTRAGLIPKPEVVVIAMPWAKDLPRGHHSPCPSAALSTNVNAHVTEVGSAQREVHTPNVTFHPIMTRCFRVSVSSL